MKKQSTALLVLLFIAVSFGQNNKLHLPVDVKAAYDKETRSYDGKPGSKYWQNTTDYKMDIKLNPAESTLEGKEEITLTHNSPQKLTQLVIRLYPDINKKESARDNIINENQMTEGVKIETILVNGDTINLDPKARKAFRRGTNLTIMLNKAFEKGSQNKIYIEWNYKIPKSSVGRTGVYDETSFMTAYFYPQLSVYDDIQGWDRLDYTGTVEFYQEFGNFDVNITVPEKYIVLATGVLQNPEAVLADGILTKFKQAKSGSQNVNIVTPEDLEKNSITKPGLTTWHYKAEYVPDFVFTTGNNLLWEAASVKLNNGKEVFISSIHHKSLEKCEEIIDIAKTGIIYFSQDMPGIPYPYPAMTVFTHLGGGGMEFPMMVNDGWGFSRGDMITTCLHEILHTYFPFYTGINQRKYAWMDEGWAVMLIYDIVKELVPEDQARDFTGMQLSQFLGTEYDVPAMVPSDVQAGNGMTYGVISYQKSAIAYEILKNLLGDDLFKKCLHEYVSRWAGKHPIPYDFFNTFNNVSGQNLNWFWKSWFFEFGYADLAITDVKEDKNNKKITLENKGNLPVPVYLKIYFEDGSTQDFTKTAAYWKDGAKNCLFELKSDKKIKKVELYNKMIPDATLNDNKLVLIKDEFTNDLNEYPGKYNLVGIPMTIDITREGEKLFGEPTGQSKMELVPVGKDEFEIQRANIKIKFLRDKNNKVVKFTFSQNGQEITAEREKAKYEDLVGNYNIVGVPMSIKITAEADKVFAEPTGQTKIEITQTAADEFEIKSLEVKIKFFRDENKSVTKFIFHQNGQEYTVEREK